MRELQGGEFSIGRGPENDWVLPDPERHLSKRHCLIAYRSGCWQLADLSTNGTYLNHETDPIGRSPPRDLRDGDRLRFGAYEIEIRIAEEDARRTRPRVAAEPLGDPFALDPFRAGRARLPAGSTRTRCCARRREGDPFAADIGPASVNLPADYDPLAPDPADAPFSGPAQADHTPHLDDAFRPGVAHPVIPEDWDREIRSPEPARPAEESPVVADAGREPRVAAAPATSHPVAATARPVMPTPRPVPPVPELTAPPTAEPGADGLLGLFLRGAQLEDMPVPDPPAAMEALGAVFRAFVAGLRQTLVARAAVKGGIPHRTDDDPGARQQSAQVLRQ